MGSTHRRFVVTPPPRCCQIIGNSPLEACGKRAEWFRPGSGTLPGLFFCGGHKLPTDRPIANGFIARRVRLQVEVLLLATSVKPDVAEAEAIEALRRGVEAALGVMGLNDARSEVGEWAPELPGKAKRARRGKGE